MKASEHSTPSSGGEQLRLRPGSAANIARIVGGISYATAAVLGYMAKDQFTRFSFAYLISFAFILSLSLGGLFFVLVQHVTKAGWSVGVRRIAECLAASMPIVGVLALPIILPMALNRSPLYPHTPDGSSAFKTLYLNPYFWSLRAVVYLAIWSLLGRYYWRQSLEQDQTGELRITNRLQALSPVALILFAVTVTLASFDFLMALDPTWSSTIFGVYIFAGSVVGVFSTLILAVLLLQKAGYLRDSITVEHYHDLGKYLFAFVFFWGYIAFSQYMLQWYANLPDEVGWFYRHGVSTQWHSLTAYTPVALLLLVGNLLIPFAALLSRHVKRTPPVLAFWAVWLLVFHWIDLYWIVMPQLDNGKTLHFGLIDLAALVGLGGLFIGVVLSRLGQGALRPLRDPRLQASIEFENV